MRDTQFEHFHDADQDRRPDKFGSRLQAFRRRRQLLKNEPLRVQVTSPSPLKIPGQYRTCTIRNEAARTCILMLHSFQPQCRLEINSSSISKVDKGNDRQARQC